MKKGFTLVEVLIVVVIIAILASLIVPRMLMQTDKAKAAEALQMLGAMKRAAERAYDFHGGFNDGAYIFSDPAGGMISGDWGDLGLTGLDKSKDWSYEYSSYADYWYVQAWSADGVHNLYYVFDPIGACCGGTSARPGVWGCDGTLFKNRYDSGGNVIGCTI
jgi:prepilin-type N-terminal cleavage/methylation domain-containing protein